MFWDRWLIKKKFTYGGRNDNGSVVPNGKIQFCKYINGNVVLISKNIFDKLGNLSPKYTHSIGDYDYGLRAFRNKINCVITKKYIATCPKNKMPDFCNPEVSLINRFKSFYSIKGLNYSEYIIFRKKFWGKKWVYFSFTAFIRTLFPRIYNILNRTYE